MFFHRILILFNKTDIENRGETKSIFFYTITNQITDGIAEFTADF